MPIFEYLCDDCGTKFEKLVRNGATELNCPSCGQKRLTQQLSVFSAHANGAPSKAAASMMTVAVKGKTRQEAEDMFGDFHRMVTGELDEENEPNNLGRLKIFAGVREYPVRVKCASLPWHTLHAAFENKEIVSTE